MKTNARRAVLGALLAGAVILGGCGAETTGAQTSSAGSGVTVTGLDTMRFSPDTITAKAGEPLVITFKNSGVIPHDLITEGGEKNVKLVNVGGGKQQSGTFLAGKPGEYRFVCIQPGHKEAGMVGTIVVK